MPWKTSTPVDLRNEFIRRVMNGETVTDLCREYGISRKTGNKFKQRFKLLGPAGLLDQSHAATVIPHKTPPELEQIIIAERQRLGWGPKKIKEVLETRLGRRLPAVSTISDILKRAGLIEARKGRPRYKARPTHLGEASGPNDIWCIDYKGQFRLGDRSYCYPLTITDQFSRFVLGCEAMAAIDEDAARETCEAVFRVRGLPEVIRSDNGAPFASTGLAGLTKLSAYWMRLGIARERSRPGHPEDNGRHERMHRTLKFETARPPRTNLLQQQERFDEFVEIFNHERPHEALGMKRPADVYQPSLRPHPDSLPEPEYPGHDDVVRVNRDGMIRFEGRQQYFAAALAGQHLGLREERDGRWLVTFLDLDLGHLGPGRKFTPIEASNPPEAN